MADGYTQVYDTEDITEASIDLFAVIVIAFVAFGGLIALLLVFNWFAKRNPFKG